MPSYNESNMATRIVREKEISVPEYMFILSQSDIDEILSFEDYDIRIISCGVSPEDSRLLLITADLKVMQLLPHGSLIPFHSLPLKLGTGILLMFRGENKMNFIDSSLVLQVSSDCLSQSKLFVNNNYMCDVEVEALTQEAHETETE